MRFHEGVLGREQPLTNSVGAPGSALRFDNLPIRPNSVDAEGGFSLCEGDWPQPFFVNAEERREQAQTRAQVIQELRQQPEVQTFEVATLTQTSSGLGLYSVIDLAQRKVWDARLSMTLLREFEPQLLNRHPSDAPHFASRACGRDSGAQMIAATLALEMAYGVAPPPLAVLARNLGQCAELIANNLYSLFLLAGPDYSEAVVSRTQPALWRKAQQTPAASALLHGVPTVAGIMLGLNWMQGHLYSEAWQLLRTARELTAMLFGKYPHPSTLYPGGSGLNADKEFFTQVLGRVNQLLDFAKRVLALWNDVVDFLLEAEPRFKQAGATPANFLSAGLWDDPAAYDASFAAGLLEAAVQCLAAQAPVLLVACDVPYPEPLHTVRPVADVFAVALVLSPASAAGRGLTLQTGLAATHSLCGHPGLDAVCSGIPAARALPLLQALARDGAADVVIEGLSDLALQLKVGAR